MDVLRISGAVARPSVFSFTDLAALAEQVDDVSALLPGRRGGAVRLTALLKVVGPDPCASHLSIRSTDESFRISVPLSAVAGAIIAYRLGAEPLPEAMGGPLRFFIPQAERCGQGDIDACANVKFLGALELLTEPGPDSRPAAASPEA